MADKPEVITSEVEASEQTVAAVRNEIPVGVSGAPIDRLPLNAQLAQMANSGITTKRIASTDRCIRVVDIPLKGGTTGQFHCSRACVRLGDMQLCPEHDKAAFAPQQTPVPKGRTINSASITLSKGEEEEMTRVSKQFAEKGDAVTVSPVQTPTRAALVPTVLGSPAGAVPAADKSGAEPHHDLKVYFTLDELSGRDVLSVIKQRICDALDGLPCRNVREMKQIVALQEKVAKLSKGGRNARTTNSDERGAN